MNLWAKLRLQFVKKEQSTTKVPAAEDPVAIVRSEFGALRERLLAEQERLFSKVEAGLSQREQQTSRLDAALDDRAAFEALADEKALALIGMLTAMKATPEMNWDGAIDALRSFMFVPGEPVPDVGQVAAMWACTYVISSLTTALADERGESVEATWQREAMWLTQIISERGSKS